MLQMNETDKISDVGFQARSLWEGVAEKAIERGNDVVGWGDLEREC